MEISRCGATSAAAAGTDTCAWMSIVALLGLISRRGFRAFAPRYGRRDEWLARYLSIVGIGIDGRKREKRMEFPQLASTLLVR